MGSERNSNWGCGAVIAFLILGIIVLYQFHRIGVEVEMGTYGTVIVAYSFAYFVIRAMRREVINSDEEDIDNQVKREQQKQHTLNSIEEIKTKSSIDKIEQINYYKDEWNDTPKMIGIRDFNTDEKFLYELTKSFKRATDDELFDSKYSFKGDEYDNKVSMIFDYFSPINENIAKFFIADLVNNTDIDPSTIFNRWVFINLIIKDNFGWYLRTHPNIIALTTLSAEEFKDEVGTYDALFHRNPDTKELYLTMNDHEVKVDSSFLKQVYLNNEKSTKRAYFQYFEDDKGNYYWEVRLENNLAPLTSMQGWNDEILN